MLPQLDEMRYTAIIMSDIEGSIEVKDSAFFNESSLTDPFGVRDSAKDLSHELSEILRGREEGSGENQLDQCVLEEAEEREEQGEDLSDMLKDVIEEDRLDDDLGKVHRFTKPILSESDLEEQKESRQQHSRTKVSALTDDTRGMRNASSAEAPSITSGQSLGVKAKPEVLLEGEEGSASLCQSCLAQDTKSLVREFCSLS